jgi:hypothetical protein
MVDCPRNMSNKPPKPPEPDEAFEEREEERQRSNERRDRGLMDQALGALKENLQNRSGEELAVVAVHYLSRLSQENPEFKEEVGDLLINELLQKRNIPNIPHLVEYAQQIGLEKEFIKERISKRFFSSKQAKASWTSSLDSIWK